MKTIRQLILIFLVVGLVSGCGEKDEEKASQNRPAIPGY
jgi:uncharacterized lipoprotein